MFVPRMMAPGLMACFFPCTPTTNSPRQSFSRLPLEASFMPPMQDEHIGAPTQVPKDIGHEKRRDSITMPSKSANDGCLPSCLVAVEQERPVFERPQDEMTPHHLSELSGAHASDIGRLPLELLSEIFLYRAAGHRRMHEGRVILRRILTQICRSWRFAALGTVWLWNDIVVNTKDNDSAYNLLLLQLERSKQCPLDVVLCHDDNEELQLGSKHSTRSWELVIQHSQRWRALGIENLDGNDFDTMTRQPIYVPLLESLVVSCDGPFHPSPVLFHALADAPRLYIVSLIIADLRGPLRFPPGWRLRSLTLELDRVVSYAHCMPMLRETAHTLEHLKIEIAFCMDTQDLHAEGTICMPKLKRLRYTSYGRFLTKRIEAPGLASLKIKDSYGDLTCITPVGGTARIGLCLRRLTKLVLEDARWDTTSFLNALHHAPNLGYLEIKETRWKRGESCVTARLLEALTRGGFRVDVGGAKSTCPLPALDEMRVSLRLNTCTRPLIRALARMALSRRTVGDASALKPLRTFVAEQVTVRKIFGRTIQHTKTLMSWGTEGPEVTCDELAMNGVSRTGKRLASGRAHTKIRSKAYVPMSSSRGYESA
ncbi:hypothetical protein K525DRAFT_283826 [Schizophyllum commune Loenen D]|nr:hypothetical protein K525DRAFT_283826 [Schizophyllum commune Loenen D]